MTEPAIKPFNFDEFIPAVDNDLPQAAPIFSEEDMRNAHQNGYDEGHAAANNSIEAEQLKALKALSETLASTQNDYDAALDHERSALKAIATEFLNTYCTAMTAENDIALAKTLLEQFLHQSTDRKPAQLTVSKSTYDDAKSRLQKLISCANASEFVSLSYNETFEIGECSVDWRGGKIARDLKTVRQAITKLINAERPSFSEMELQK